MPTVLVIAFLLTTILFVICVTPRRESFYVFNEMIQPIEVASHGRSSSIRNAYHYDKMLEQWPSVVKNMNAMNKENTLLKDGMWIPCDEEDVPKAATVVLQNHVLELSGIASSHMVAFSQIKSPEKFVSNDATGVAMKQAWRFEWVVCLIAPGKSHALCCKGHATVSAFPEIRVIAMGEISSYGVLSESYISDVKGVKMNLKSSWAPPI